MTPARALLLPGRPKLIVPPPLVIHDRILEMAGDGRVPRIVGYRAAGYTYRLDAIAGPYPEFLVPHGTWKRGAFDHQRRRIEDIEVVEVGGVLMTSVRQTLADLCAVVHLDVVERAVESALRMGLVSELELRDFAYLYTFARKGAQGLREVLDRRPHGAPPTGSDAETVALQVWRYGGVRTPERQHLVVNDSGEFVAEVDFGFVPYPLVAEIDGLTYHGPEQQQYDLNRQNRIEDLGITVRRFTYWDVMQRPRYLCRTIQRALLTVHPAPRRHR